MDLRDRLLELVAPLRVGDEVLPGLRLDEACTELGLGLRLRGDGGIVDVELLPKTGPAKHVAETERFWLAYRHRGEGSDLGRRACEAVARAVAANEASVLEALRVDLEGSEGKQRVREVEVTRILETTQSDTDTFYTLSPYVGCLIGCRFCYAQSRLQPLRDLLGLKTVAWGSWADVRVNAAEVLAEEVRRLPPRPIKFCPIVSDPYQALEQRHRVTRRCLEVMADAPAGFTTLLLTRSTAILEDVERIASLPLAFAGVSLPTVDDEVRRHFEPRAASIHDRLRVLETLHTAGVRTIAVVQPQLPGPIEALADALSNHCDSVSIDVLRGEQGAASLFADLRFAATRAPDWQLEHAHALRDALLDRGVPVWSGELPPDLEVS